ncbi:MAG: hypothetical protein ACYS22_14480, partial [Planctomycetota bacterium]
ESLTISDLNADISIESSQLFARAHFQPRWAKEASMVVRANLGRQDEAAEFQIAIEANKVLVNPELTRPLLPLKNRRLLDQLRPQGIADVSVTIEDGGGGGGPQVSGEVLILNGGISFVRFPYPIENATGRVEISEHEIRLRDIKGAREHGRFSCEGEIQVSDPGKDDYLDLRIKVEQIRLDEALAQALPHKVETVYRRFAPTGRASADVWIHGFTKPPGIPDEIQVDIDGSVSGVTARFDGFPVPVTGVIGGFQVHNETVTIDDARGQVGSGRVRVDGTAGAGSVRIDIEAEGVEASEEIIQALPSPADALVRSLRPTGAVNAWATVTDRPDSRTEAHPGGAPNPGIGEVSLSVRVQPQPGFGVRYERFPYPMTLQRGTVFVDDRGRVRLVGLEASGPKAEGIRLEGSVGQGPTDVISPPSPARLHVTAERVVVDDEFRQALAEVTGAAGNEPPWLTPIGLVDGVGSLRDLNVDIDLSAGLTAAAREDPSNEGVQGAIENITASFAFEGMALKPGGLEPAVTSAGGRVTLADGRVSLRDVTGSLLGGRVSLVGDLDVQGLATPRHAASGQPMVLEGSNLAIDPRLREALASLGEGSQELSETLDRLGLENQGTIERVRVEFAGPHGGAVPVGDEMAWPSPVVESRFRGAVLKAEAFPYRVTQVAGTLRFAEGALHLDSVTGRAGTGRVAARGRLGLGGPQAERGDAIRLELTDVPIDNALRRALPPKIAGALDSVAPQYLDVSFDGFRVRVDQRLPQVSGVGYISPTEVVEGGGLLWNTETVLRIPKLVVGVPLDDVVVQAHLTGVFPHDNEVLAEWPVLAQGVFSIPQASWNAQPIHEATANVEVRNDRFLVTDLEGVFLGGRFAAAKTFYRFDGLRAGGRFTLENGRVENWRGLNDDRAPNERWFGRLDGFIEFDGIPGSENPELRLGGKGKVSVREGRFLKIPILGANLDRADVDVSLKGGATEGASGRVLLDRIIVSNPGFTVRGDGEISGSNINAKLSIRILRETAEDSLLVQLLRSPLWLLGQIFGAIIDVEVEGPITKPDVKARVLPIFQDMVE